MKPNLYICHTAYQVLVDLLRAGRCACENGPHTMVLSASVPDTAALAASHKRIAVVGGGIGTAPLLLLCKELCRAGVRPDLFVGFRDTTYGMDRFVPWCRDIYAATDSGKEGHHGLVTDLLDVSKYDIVLTCGPMVMMRGVAKLCAAAGVPCLASLEKKMACGLGACLGCTCHTKIGPVTVCKDGPVFNAQEVFD